MVDVVSDAVVDVSAIDACVVDVVSGGLDVVVTAAVVVTKGRDVTDGSVPEHAAANTIIARISMDRIAAGYREPRDRQSTSPSV